MKLYNYYISPFTARVRMVIYAKGLDVTIVNPPGGLASEEYRRLSPTGKIPSMVVDDMVLVESSTMCEFLEECHPEPALLPKELKARAYMRALAQIADTQLAPSTLALLRQTKPVPRNPAVIAEHTILANQSLDMIERLLRQGKQVQAASGLNLADCALFPHVLVLQHVMAVLSDANPFGDRTSLRRWWDAVQPHEPVQRVRGEMERAMTEYQHGNIL